MRTLFQKTCLIVLLIVFVINAIAQNKTRDSLKQALDYYKKDDTIKLKMMMHYSFFIEDSSIDYRIYYRKQILQLANKNHSNRGIVVNFLRLAQLYSDNEEYDSSIIYNLEGLHAAENLNEKQMMPAFYYELGEDYRLVPNYILAEYYDLKYLDFADTSKYERAKLLALENLAILYSAKGDIAKEEEFSKKGLAVAIDEKDTGTIAKLYQLDAERYMVQKNFGQAKKLLINLQETWNSIKNYRELSYAQSLLSKIFITTHNNDSAAYYANAALATAKKYKLKKEIGDAYNALFTFHLKIHDYKNALAEKFILDSIHYEQPSGAAVQTILTAEMKYKQEKKDLLATVEQVKKDAEYKRIKNLQYQIIIALAIIVLAVVIISMIQSRNNKQKQKANLLLERQKQKVENTLTELKSTQVQLIQSEKMASLGELTAGIAHEIQNPLNFVNNFSEVSDEMMDEMKEELASGNLQVANEIANDIKQNLQKINHHGKRADSIVKGMLQHSRQTKGVKELVDINALCDEYLRLSYHGLRAKDKNFNADFKTDFDGSISKINIVPQDMGRVLLNLFNNAFYAVNEKKKTSGNDYQPCVSVTTKRRNDKIEIIVKDNGNGIPQSIIDKVFQPFFTTKPTGQGTGLGLSLSYDIVTKEHGGTIKVESKEGKGTEFIINLPAQ